MLIRILNGVTGKATGPGQQLQGNIVSEMFRYLEPEGRGSAERIWDDFF